MQTFYTLDKDNYGRWQTRSIGSLKILVWCQTGTFGYFKLKDNTLSFHDSMTAIAGSFSSVPSRLQDARKRLKMRFRRRSVAHYEYDRK